MGTMDEHEACEVGQTAPTNVAGRTIGNPLAAVIAYLKEHPGTVTHYDLIAGTSDEVWRPDRLHRHQELGRQVEQQRWRVMLHRPVRQELFHLLHLPATGRRALPAQVLRYQQQVIAAGMRTAPVSLQHLRICSSENIRAATATTPTTHGQNRTNRSGRDQYPSAERT